MRGLDNVKFILSDETDYYPPFQQTEVRAVMEGYIGKPNSDPTIVMVSTPKAPGGLMQQIELEPDSLYHKLFFDYTYVLQGPYPIYSQEQIDRARQSPSFEREFNLKYLGLKQHRQEGIRTKGDCCFNHIIGLPKKTGIEKPLFDYEMQVIRALLENDYLNSLGHYLYSSI
jgi:hypothetical protein